MARRGLLVDIGPLRRYPLFRRLWFGYLVTTLGNQLTVVAVAFEVFKLTHSSLDVGLVSFVESRSALEEVYLSQIAKGDS